jgi:hypothetical protein
MVYAHTPFFEPLARLFTRKAPLFSLILDYARDKSGPDARRAG